MWHLDAAKAGREARSLPRTKRELPSVRLLRQSVGDVLATRENRLILIKSQILLLLFVALHVALTQVLSQLQSILSSVSAVAYLLFALYVLLLVAVWTLLTLPAVIGFLRLAREMEQGRIAVTADLFAVFSEKHLYRESIRLSWRVLWRVFVTVLLVKATVCFSSYYFAGNLAAGLICGIVVLFELIGGVCLIFHGFPLLAELLEGERRLHSKRLPVFKGSIRTGVHFFTGFLPWLLLGILSYGILLLGDVVPCMAVAYFRYCRVLKEQNLNIHSEE